jgi:hypothetical protein
VDLAGSESHSKTLTTGDSQREGVQINQSLLALRRVLNSLHEGQTHIPFRDSELTKVRCTVTDHHHYLEHALIIISNSISALVIISNFLFAYLHMTHMTLIFTVSTALPV